MEMRNKFFWFYLGPNAKFSQFKKTTISGEELETIIRASKNCLLYLFITSGKKWK